MGVLIALKRKRVKKDGMFIEIDGKFLMFNLNISKY